jgi:sugar phosphate permease
MYATFDDKDQLHTPIYHTENEPLKKNTWRFRFLQFSQIFFLFFTYGSVYLFLVVLSISTPLMTSTKFITIQEISVIIIITKIARAFSKMVSGTIVDTIGGKQVYLVVHFLIAAIVIVASIKPGELYQRIQS